MYIRILHIYVYYIYNNTHNTNKNNIIINKNSKQIINYN